MHNAAFDLGYLAQRGIEPVGVDCTMQAVRLLNGPNATSLETAAATYFGLELNKALQTSDWGAKHLSLAQVDLRGDDAVVTWHLAETVLPLLGERRTAYDIQVGAIPAVVRMQLRGILLDTTAHAALDRGPARPSARGSSASMPRRVRQAGRPDLRRAGVPDNAPAIEALLAGIADGTGAGGLAADAEERQAQHQAGRPCLGRGRLSAAPDPSSISAASRSSSTPTASAWRRRSHRSPAAFTPPTRSPARTPVAAPATSRTCRTSPTSSRSRGCRASGRCSLRRPGYVFVDGRLVGDGDAGGRLHFRRTRP